MRSGRIAYLLTAFPTVSETFVEGEIRGLMARGLPLDLYAIRNLREAVSPEDGPGDRGLDVFRSPYLLGGEVGRALARFLLRRPGRTIGAFLTVLFGNLPSLRYLLQALALFPKNLVFAERMEARGTVHVHATWGHYPATSAFVISRVLDVPFSFSAHAGLDVTGNTTFQSFKVRQARFVLTCNEANRRFLAARNPGCSERIHAVYHGVSLSAIPAPGSIPRSQPPEIVSVGRLAPEKGFRDLVLACRLLKERGLDFRARIFGEGPERRGLAREIQARELGDRIALEGIVPHVRILEACARASVVVLASYRGPHGYLDGISNVLVEAMACGTSVITTDHPASRELFEGGRVGPLVPQRNPEKLAEAMERALRDRTWREELGQLGRRRVEEAFSREENLERIARLFQAVLQDRTRPALQEV